MADKKSTHQEINIKELNALIERVEHAIENELALSVEDLKLLLLAIHTLSTLQKSLEEKNATLYKLRKLLGMIKQSERRSSGKNNPSNKKGNKNSNVKSNNNKSNKPPKVIHHRLEDVKKGDRCAECQRGRLYKFEPAQLLRISGHSPYEATQHVSERMRCNACQIVVTATLPQEVLDDGTADQRYGYSARALMALHKFYSGLPYYHQGNLSTMMGVNISASTIFDQCEHLANAIMPIFYELIRIAANAKLFLMDDTPHRILTQQPEERPNRNGSGTRKRTGVYTSGLVAYTDEGHEIVLFETSLGHAGEFIDDLLKKRDKALPAPTVMSDALSSNKPTVIEVQQAYCNSHCRREFFDIKDQKPGVIDWVLETYGKIWENDAYTKEKSFSGKERLEYHKKHSLPVMEELKSWAEKQINSDDFEEHSTFGKAVKYLHRHYEKLTLFCRVAGVPIDNNRMEETLKLIIRSRKTAHFFKTINGAGVANVLTTAIGTAMRTNINIFDYFVLLQRHQDAVKKHPKRWLPWNYKATIKSILEERQKVPIT